MFLMKFGEIQMKCKALFSSGKSMQLLIIPNCLDPLVWGKIMKGRCSYEQTELTTEAGDQVKVDQASFRSVRLPSHTL